MCCILMFYFNRSWFPPLPHSCDFSCSTFLQQVRRTRCASPVEKADTLRRLRREWGSEAAFDQFVSRQMHPAQLQVGGNASIFLVAHALQVAAGLVNTEYSQQGSFPLAALRLEYALSIFPILVWIHYLHRISRPHAWYEIIWIINL